MFIPLLLFRNSLWDKSLKNINIVILSRGSVPLFAFYAPACGWNRKDGHFQAVIGGALLNDFPVSSFGSTNDAT